MAQAWVTLATNDSYALGAMVLGRSLKQVGTTRKLHVLVTPGVSDGMREHLASVYDFVTEVNVLDSKDEANLALIKRPELGVTFTKFHCWLLTQYTKCVFLDADCLVIQNSDELFDYPELSAAPDIGWPDIFNSGVFVFVPAKETFHNLLQCALEKGSFDGGDQGVLNTFFSTWRDQGPSHRLPFTYNMSSNVVYTYTAAFKRFAKDVKIVHFLGAVKPWHHNYDAERKTVHFRPESQTHVQYIRQWWAIFSDSVLPVLKKEFNLDSGKAQQRVGNTAEFLVRRPDSGPIDETERQAAWERGNIDYTGRDSWENIQKHLDKQLQK